MKVKSYHPLQCDYNTPQQYTTIIDIYYLKIIKKTKSKVSFGFLFCLYLMILKEQKSTFQYYFEIFEKQFINSHENY